MVNAPLTVCSVFEHESEDMRHRHKCLVICQTCRFINFNFVVIAKGREQRNTLIAV